MNRLWALLAIGAIRLYQLFLSRWTGKVCLFRPTCSQRAIESFRAKGWRLGLAEVHAQRLECCGTYSIRMDAAGRLELISASGRVYREAELARSVLAQFEVPAGGRSLPPAELGL